jgi:hypothetical protein
VGLLFYRTYLSAMLSRPTILAYVVMTGAGLGLLRYYSDQAHRRWAVRDARLVARPIRGRIVSTRRQDSFLNVRVDNEPEEIGFAPAYQYPYPHDEVRAKWERYRVFADVARKDDSLLKAAHSHYIYLKKKTGARYKFRL